MRIWGGRRDGKRREKERERKKKEGEREDYNFVIILEQSCDILSFSKHKLEQTLKELGTTTSNSNNKINHTAEHGNAITKK